MDNAQIEAALDKVRPWQSAYVVVEEQARYYLDALMPSSPGYSTADLVGAIYTGENEKVRRRIFNGLAALATRSLIRYVRYGEPETIAGRRGRRKVWGYPSQEIIPPTREVCPTCKRPL